MLPGTGISLSQLPTLSDSIEYLNKIRRNRVCVETKSDRIRSAKLCLLDFPVTIKGDKDYDSYKITK